MRVVTEEPGRPRQRAGLADGCRAQVAYRETAWGRGNNGVRWSLELMEPFQSMLSISISSRLLLAPLPSGVETKRSAWDSGWEERLFGVPGLLFPTCCHHPVNQAFASLGFSAAHSQRSMFLCVQVFQEVAV